MKNLIKTAALIAALTFTAPVVANDPTSPTLEEAGQSYNEFIELISTGERQRKSAGNIVLEGHIVSDEIGTTVATRDLIGGYLSRENMPNIARPLYVESNYGLYVYQGLAVSVWYDNGYASVIILTFRSH